MEAFSFENVDIPNDLKVSAKPKARKTYEIKKILDFLGIEYSEKVTDKGSIVFTLTCWNDPNHKDGETMIFQNEDGSAYAFCHHDSCKEKKDSIDTALDILANGKDYSQFVTTPKKAGKISKSDVVVSAAKNKISEMFFDQYKTPYVVVDIGKRHEAYAVPSSDFKKWLLSLCFQQTGKGMSDEDYRTATNNLLAQMFYEGAATAELWYRTAWSKFTTHDEPVLYYDLGNIEWQAVKVTKSGWEVVQQPAIFKRYANLAMQVKPTTDGDINDIFNFINVKTEDGKLLLLVWLIAAFIPGFPHAILVISGSQGSGKTFLFRLFKKLIDPGVRLTDSPSKDEGDLIRKFANQWFTPLDNLSSLPGWMSDVICRAINGDGFSTRTLYTTNDEFILQFRRIIGINGINQIATSPDILDRAILIEFDRIEEEKRKTEAILDKDIAAALPGFLGSIFNIIAKAFPIYAELINKPPAKLPRMADFSIWCEAISRAMGNEEGRFIKAYFRSVASAVDEVVAGHPLAQALVLFAEAMKEKQCILRELSPNELLSELDALAAFSGIRTLDRTWPKTSKTMGREINKLKVTMAEKGIFIKSGRGHKRFYTITLQGRENDDANDATAQNMDQSDFPARHDAPAENGLTTHTTQNDSNVRHERHEASFDNEQTAHSNPLELKDMRQVRQMRHENPYPTGENVSDGKGPEEDAW